MTKEEVIKRLTAFGFLQEETSVVVKNIRTRTEAIPAMVYKLPYHDEKLAFFQISSHYCWVYIVLEESNRTHIVTKPGKFGLRALYAFDPVKEHCDRLGFFEYDRKTQFKDTGIVLKTFFKCQNILDDLVIVVNYLEKSKSAKFSQRLEYIVGDHPGLLNLTFQYIQKKVEPGIFFDYLKEREPTLFGRF